MHPVARVSITLNTKKKKKNKERRMKLLGRGVSDRGRRLPQISLRRVEMHTEIGSYVKLKLHAWVFPYPLKISSLNHHR